MDLEHWLLCKYRRAAMNREKCINRNITIASAIISGVNILTFYNAFYKCFKVKYVDDFISLLCLLFSLMILINVKQHIRTIEFCMWYSILFIILLCRINIFVFTQRDTARFQVLILSAYLCCLYLLNIRDLLRKI